MKCFGLLTIIYAISLQVGIAQTPQLRFQSGHSGGINAVAWSSDARFIVSGSADKSAIIVDARTFRVLHTLKGHMDDVSSVAISADNQWIATASYDNTIKVWDAVTGEEQYTLTAKIWRPNQIQFSPDGKKLAFAGNRFNDYAVLGWFDLETKSLQMSFPDVKSEVKRIVYSPKGEFLYAAGNMGYLMKINAQTGAMVYNIEIRTKPLEWYTSPTALALSPDGNTLAVGWNFDRQNIEIFDPHTGKKKKTLRGHSSNILALSFTPDGKQVISTNWSSGSVPGHIKFWDVETSEEVKTIKGMKSDFIRSHVVSNDGRYLLAGHGGELYLWDIATLKTVKTLNSLKTQLFLQSFDPTSSSILVNQYWYGATFGNSGSSYSMKSLKVGQQRFFSDVITNADNYPRSILISGGSQIVTLDPTHRIVHVRSMPQKELIRQWKPYPDNNVDALYVTDDGKWVITGGVFINSYHVWDIATGKLIKEIGVPPSTYGPNSVTVSKDKKRVYVGYSGVIQAYDATDWNILFSYKPASLPLNLILSDNQRLLLSALQNGTVEVFDVIDQKVVFRHRANTAALRTAIWNADQKHIITGGDDGVVRVWNYVTGKVLHEKALHNNRITNITHSPDGAYLFSSSSDGTMGVWRTSDYAFVAQLFFKDQNDWAVVSADGKFDGTPDALQLIHYVKGTEIIPIEAFFEQNYTPNLLANVLSGKQAITPGLTQVREVGLPPRVKFLRPATRELTQASQQIILEIEATDMGGGIDEVRLFHNGRLVSDQTRGLRPKAQAGQSLVRTFTLNLVSGRNEFRALALNSQRTESEPAEVVVHWSAPKAGSALHILAIGIDEYKNPRYNLNYGKADAKAYTQAIKQMGGNIFNSISIKELHDKEATRNTILSALREIQQKARPEDVFMLFYAGHGIMSEGDATTPSDFYMALHSITQLYGNDVQLKDHGISATEIRTHVAQIPALKQVIVLDACQSGGAVQTFAMRGAAEEKALMNLARSTGVVVFASTGSEQFATEFGQLGHGVFTYALLEGLKGKADVSPKDGQVTVQELNVFLNYRVPELTEQYRGTAQYPNTWVRGMDFPMGVIKN